jgi:hypothetical protein
MTDVRAAAGDDLKSKLSDIVSKASNGKKPRIVIEGYPSSLDIAERFQKEVIYHPILLVSFADDKHARSAQFFSTYSLI